MSLRPPKLLRRTALLATVGIVFALAGPVPLPVDAQTADAQLTQDGWWNRLQGSIVVGPVQEPANPLRDTVNPQVPAPPTVPGNALAVGAAGGESAAIAAVGIATGANDGGTVSVATLTLKESSEPGANANSALAKVAACPITNFWAGARNGAWVDRPAFECADPGAVEGKRAPDGTWTFDLTRVAQSWLDGNLEPNGVVFAPVAGSPENFQVSFLDIGSGTMTLQFSATPPLTFDDTPTFEPTPVEEPTQDFSDFEDPVVPAEPPPPVEVPPPPLEGAMPEPPVEEAPPPKAAGLGDIPWAAFLLIPIVLALAAALSYALGAAGRPDPSGVRTGTVSRVLASRRVAAEA